MPINVDLWKIGLVLSTFSEMTSLVDKVNGRDVKDFWKVFDLILHSFMIKNSLQ